MKQKGIPEEKVLRVKDLNTFTPNLNLDWLHIINEQLPLSIKLSEQDEILLISPTTLKSLATALETIDKG